MLTTNKNNNNISRGITATALRAHAVGKKKTTTKTTWKKNNNSYSSLSQVALRAGAQVHTHTHAQAMHEREWESARHIAHLHDDVDAINLPDCGCDCVVPDSVAFCASAAVDNVVVVVVAVAARCARWLTLLFVRARERGECACVHVSV